MLEEFANPPRLPPHAAQVASGGLYYFHSTMNKALGGAERATTIDEVPLWCLQPGVKLDFRYLPDRQVVTAREVEAEFARISHALRPLEIVVVNTRAGSADYVSSGCGIEYEATM